jgi:hypothetical protein
VFGNGGSPRPEVLSIPWVLVAIGPVGEGHICGDAEFLEKEPECPLDPFVRLLVRDRRRARSCSEKTRVSRRVEERHSGASVCSSELDPCVYFSYRLIDQLDRAHAMSALVRLRAYEEGPGLL